MHFVRSTPSRTESFNFRIFVNLPAKSLKNIFDGFFFFSRQQSHGLQLFYNQYSYLSRILTKYLKKASLLNSSQLMLFIKEISKALKI